MPVSIPSELRSAYEAAGQEHVFKWADEGKLSDAEVEKLLGQLRDIDLPRLKQIFESAMHGSHAPLGDIEPLDSFDSLVDGSDAQKAEWYEIGIQAIGRGEVALNVLSGGQGTRLGFDGPKGMYNIGLPSQKTLFQLFAERVVRLQAVAAAAAGIDSVTVPWYIMTSQMNDGITRNFFKEHNYFGLSESQVIFFAQGVLPALTVEGKLIMETGHSLSLASDGNGGIYPALEKCGCIKDMERRGIKYMHTYAVDNALCRVADPTFIGYCISKGADCGNKVVWKTNPNESVGVVGKRGGKFCVIEYSELDAASAARTDKNGKLVFGAGNICNHFYSLEFLRDVVIPNMNLSYHIAQKKIPTANADGKSVKPDKNNGVKMECFIFDAFPMSKTMAVLEAKREEEFSPVKNAPGTPVDSPDSARMMVSDLHKKWYTASGGKITGDHAALFEISPLVSYAGEGLEKAKGHKVSLADPDTPVVLNSLDE